MNRNGNLNGIIEGKIKEMFLDGMPLPPLCFNCRGAYLYNNIQRMNALNECIHSLNNTYIHTIQMK